MSDHQKGVLGVVGEFTSWTLVFIGTITMQDAAWFLACCVSLGTLWLQADKYINKGRQHMRSFREWREGRRQTRKRRKS